jgi:peroxiredoxin
VLYIRNRMSDRTETLAAGSRAPEFLLSAANRDGILSLSGFLSRGALIAEFLRGTWCPNCVKRMAQLEPMKTEIEQAGAQLVYIAAEKSTGVWKPAKFLQSHRVSFPFLLDEDRAVTKAYGLYHRLGVDAINIAHPATLVIDRDRKVTYIYRGDNQTDRAPFNQVMEAVKKLSVSV